MSFLCIAEVDQVQQDAVSSQVTTVQLSDCGLLRGHLELKVEGVKNQGHDGGTLFRGKPLPLNVGEMASWFLQAGKSSRFQNP